MKRIFPIESCEILLVASLLLTSCGPGAVGKAVRPEMRSASDAMGTTECVGPDEDAEPWVIDLKADARGALRAAMDRGVVVVGYDCKNLKIVRGCTVMGRYEYSGTGFNEDTLRLEDADSVRATLSGGLALAAKLEAELERGTKLDIAYAVVGERNTTLPSISKAQLRGECKGATHFVAAASLGAFVMRSSTAAQVGAAVEVFGQGAGTSSSSSAQLDSNSGKRAACERASSNDPSPLADCDVPLRVRLVPIRDKAAEGRASGTRLPASCPRGTVRFGPACITPKRAPARVCKVGDAQSCEEQCKKGEGTSCAILGNMYEKGKGVSEDPRRAMELYEQACRRRNLDGCAGMGFLYSKGEGVAPDKKRAEALFREACDKGNGRACSGIGHQLRLSGDANGAVSWLERACRLGYGRACFYAGALLYKAGREPERAVRNYANACVGQDLRGCLAQSVLVSTGTGAAANASEALALKDRAMQGLERACQAKDGDACETLGDYHMGQYDKSVKKPELAIGFYTGACGGGSNDSCMEAARIYEAGSAPYIKKNPKVARQLFEVACARGLAEACTKAGKKRPVSAR